MLSSQILQEGHTAALAKNLDPELALQNSPNNQISLIRWRPEISSCHSGSDTRPTPPAPVILHDCISPPHRSTMSSTSSDFTDLEKLTAILPPKRLNSFMRTLRWSIFSVYRRLNLLVLLPNLIAIIVLAVHTGIFEMSVQAAATAVSVNVVVAVLIRQELVINLLFAACGKCPQSMPLRLRRLLAKIYHLGGVHSGAGLAAVIWFFVFNAVLAREWSRSSVIAQEPCLLPTTGIIDLLLLSIVVMAHPRIRAKHHNWFEATHRFSGWLVVALFWGHMFLLAKATKKTQSPEPPLSKLIVRSAVFWALLIVTISLILPWIFLRKVDVQSEHLSSHVTRLHFTYANLPLCAGARISDNPLKEWHAFAGIPDESGNGFSLLISKAGDWTSRIIKSPPTKLWVRGIPTRGVLHIAPLFKRTVLVATGSGIGPVMSLLAACELNCRILWSANDPLNTYKSAIMDQVMRADPGAIIINTDVSGRPDLIQEAYNMYVASDAEAVFIISNAKVTRSVVYELESRGVPIFAPIFDS